MLKKPLLPEWRYWPGLALVALMLAAAIGFSFQPPHLNNSEYHHSHKETQNGSGEMAVFTHWLGTWSAEDGAIDLYLVGYVDYRDNFGGRYRAGYARQYFAALNATGNNLGYATIPGYNYDRVRKPREGWDA